MEGSRVLVTGRADLIGRCVVSALVERGAAVSALVERGAAVTVAALREVHVDRVTSLAGDLCEPSAAARAAAPGTGVIIHLAAVTSVLRSIEDPVGTDRLNVDATAKLLEPGRASGVGTFILASTNAVAGDVGLVGDHRGGPAAAAHPLRRDQGGREMLMSACPAAYRMRCAALRFSNVYGPGMQAKDSFIPRLTRAVTGAHPGRERPGQARARCPPSSWTSAPPAPLATSLRTTSSQDSQPYDPNGRPQAPARRPWTERQLCDRPPNR